MSLQPQTDVTRYFPPSWRGPRRPSSIRTSAADA